jgi:hypothetical protein
MYIYETQAVDVMVLKVCTCQSSAPEASLTSYLEQTFKSLLVEPKTGQGMARLGKAWRPDLNFIRLHCEYSVQYAYATWLI